MKVFLVFVLLALSTSAYTATVGPIEGAQTPALRKEDEQALAKESGKTMEYIGKLLQGSLSLKTAEDQDRVLNALETLNTGLAEAGDDEYAFFLVLLQAVLAAAVTSGVSAGVATTIDRAIKKGIAKKQKKNLKIIRSH